MGPQLRHGSHGGLEIFLLDRARRLGLGGIDRLSQRLFLRLLIVRRVRRASVLLVILFLLDPNAIRCAPDASQQILTVIDIEEFFYRLDTQNDQTKLI